MNNKYNPQTFLEECKYEINKMKNFINDDFDSSSSDEFDNESDNESDNEESNGSNNEESNDEFVNDESETGFDN